MNRRNKEMDCICITAYKSPEMLSELLAAVEDDFHCFVHIDKRQCDLFRSVKRQHPKVFFYEAFPVDWGGL